MPRKTKKPKAKPRRSRASPQASANGSGVVELPVAYKNLNVGDVTCRLGLSVSRGALSIATADAMLCGKRLTGTVLARASGGADQGSLPGLDDDRRLSAVFDVKGFSASKKSIGFGLTFAIESVDVSELAHFAKRAGTLTIEHVEDLPEEARKGDDSAEDDDHPEDAED